MDPHAHPVLADVLALMLSSDHHCRYTVDTVMRCIVPPIHLGQHIGVERNGRFVAWASWAWLTPSKAEAFLAGDYNIQPGDWRSGDTLVFMDFIAPDGDARALYRTLRNLFATIPADIVPGAAWVRFTKHGRIGVANNGQR